MATGDCAPLLHFWSSKFLVLKFTNVLLKICYSTEIENYIRWKHMNRSDDFIILCICTLGSHWINSPFSCPVIIISSKGPHTEDVTLGPGTGTLNTGVLKSARKIINQNDIQLSKLKKWGWVKGGIDHKSHFRILSIHKSCFQNFLSIMNYTYFKNSSIIH